MSRVGNKPIAVPDGVDVVVNGKEVSVKGKLGESAWSLPDTIAAEVKENEVHISREGDEKQAKSLHGTSRSLIANMISGVSEGFKKELEISGVGYRAQMQGTQLVMNVGFSHPIEYDIPVGVTVEVKDNVKLTVTGVDKQQVGLVAARIRAFCKAEPYKGKGIKYKDEHVRRKVGKTVA